MSQIPDERKLPKIDRFGYLPKTYFLKGEGGANYFLEPSVLENFLCNTIEESIKSIDKLIINNERFL
jgi:hypothetical protein